MQKKYNVYLTQHAQEDLEHAYSYIASDSIDNATLFITEIEKNIYTLEIFPFRNPLIPENEFFKTDYRHLIYKKYRTIYRVTENSVFILRIIHSVRLLDI